MGRYHNDDDLEGFERISGLPIGEYVFALLVHGAWAALVMLALASIWMGFEAFRNSKWRDAIYSLGGLVYSIACLTWWYIEAPAYFMELAIHVATLVAGIIVLWGAAKFWDRKVDST